MSAMLDADRPLAGHEVSRLVEEIEHRRRGAHISQKVFSGDADPFVGEFLVQSVVQGAIRQLHGDDQVSFLLPGPKHRKQTRMSNGANDVERLEFDLASASSQRHEFDGLWKSAGAGCRPYFAKPAATQPSLQ